jgi:hypothetical protein
MLGKLILIMMLLCVAASAETIIVGNYSIDFDFNKTHIVEDLGQNTTAVKTFDGYIAFIPGHLDIDIPENAGLIGHLYIDGTKGEMGEFYSYKDGKHIDYVLNCAHWYAFSTMSLQDTLDFLQFMKSNPAKAKTYALPYPTLAETFTLSKKEAIARSQKDLAPLNFSM